MWESYISYTPSAAKIAKLFDEDIVNDHIAFRTLNLQACNIHKQANYLSKFGYKIGGDYYFEQKKTKCHPLGKRKQQSTKNILIRTNAGEVFTRA